MRSLDAVPSLPRLNSGKNTEHLRRLHIHRPPTMTYRSQNRAGNQEWVNHQI